MSDHAFIPFRAWWSTPFARWQGSLANMNSIRLAAVCAQRALAARAIALDAIDAGLLGITVIQRGGFYGLPWLTGMMGLDRVPGTTIQQACATSARALQMAASDVALGASDCTLVVTADRCSNAPILYHPDPSGPGGTGLTERWLLDAFEADPYANVAMVDTAENVARRYEISMAEQHELVLLRDAQYREALANDRAFQRRYMIDAPIFDAGFRRETGALTADEGVRTSTPEGLARLKPVRAGGTVTHGGQTFPADGNAGALVTTRARARELSADPAILVQLLGFGQARVDKGYMPAAVAPACARALASADIGFDAVDAVKTHNPFAVNDIAFARETGVALDRMNRYGCSLVWGHPQGPTGLRAIIELAEELAERGGGIGLFGGCAAGDSAVAAVIKVG